MSKIFEYINSLEKLLIGYMVKSKRNIKKTNKKIKDISILLAQQGFTPKEICNCFDLNTYYYNKETEYYSDDDGENDEQREDDLLNNTKVISLSEGEQNIVHENPITMMKNLKKLFFEKNELLKNLGLIERNKWSKVSHDYDEMRLLHKKRKSSDNKS